jgi:hypothetical protein
MVALCREALAADAAAVSNDSKSEEEEVISEAK